MKDRIPRRYEAPRIVHRDELKRFAGSPLGKILGNPLKLPGEDN